jgi:hypothetical protein
MKTFLRQAEPKDMPALLHLLAEQNRRDNTRYPLPEIFDEHGRQADYIPLALVAVRGEEVFGGIVFESKGVEMMLIGCSPRVTLMAAHERQGILYTLKAMGFRWIRSLVTKSVVKNLTPAMKEAGFRRDDKRFASFFREV